MTKSRDSRKDAKKAPIKTLKEKRLDKHIKKDAEQHPEFLSKVHTAPGH
jgi:hypothetical protein